MADNRRTLSANLALLPDNTTQDISPQDHRDAHLSSSDVYGGLYFTVPAQTTIAVATTAVKSAGTTADLAVGSHADITVSVANRLTWGSGLPTIRAKISVTARLVAAASNKDLSVVIAKNGVVIADSLMTIVDVDTTNPHMVTAFTIVELEADDYVEVWLANETDTQNMTLQQGIMILEGLYT